MICYARSGGTVLNKCLGVQPDVFIASEVNPAVEALSDQLDPGLKRVTLISQAKEWLGLELKGATFVERVRELRRHCTDNRLELLIRDWTFVNFNPHSTNSGTPPCRLLTLQQLSAETGLRPFAFVRDAIDIWISRGTPDPAPFFASYRLFVEQLKKYPVPIYRYEDFCREPAKVLKEICSYLGIRYADGAIQGYQDFTHVIGDDQVPGGSRGRNQNRIGPLLRKRIPADKVRILAECRDVEEVQQMMGYPAKYSAVPLESRWSEFAHMIRRTIKLFSR